MCSKNRVLQQTDKRQWLDIVLAAEYIVRVCS